MSALHHRPTQIRNRRSAERVKVTDTITVLFGRSEGTLVDLSQQGARIRHFSPVRRGSSVRVSFEWERQRFAATAEVLASRVVSLGSGPSYESRVRFTHVDENCDRVLTMAVERLEGRNVRRWVANLNGWTDEPQAIGTPRFQSTSFIRCRLLGNRWEIKRIGDQTQPEDGFVLPPDSSDADIETLCDNYSRGGDEERQLIRLMARAAVDQATVGR